MANIQQLRVKTQHCIESKTYSNSIILVILINAVVLGMTASGKLFVNFHTVLMWVDYVCLGVFVIELGLRFFVYKENYFKDPWRLFDFIIVSVALLPSAQVFSVARALRVLRIIEAFPRLRMVVESLVVSIPSMLSVVAILILIYYVYGVIGTMLFGHLAPTVFGSLGKSMFTLFQIMTLDSWSSVIAKPIIAELPWSRVYFISFIMITSMAVLNLVVGLLVSAIQEQHDILREAAADSEHKVTQKSVMKAVKELNQEILILKEIVVNLKKSDSPNDPK